MLAFILFSLYSNFSNNLHFLSRHDCWFSINRQAAPSPYQVCLSDTLHHLWHRHLTCETGNFNWNCEKWYICQLNIYQAEEQNKNRILSFHKEDLFAVIVTMKYAIFYKQHNWMTFYCILFDRIQCWKKYKRWLSVRFWRYTLPNGLRWIIIHEKIITLSKKISNIHKVNWFLQMPEPWGGVSRNCWYLP